MPDNTKVMFKRGAHSALFDSTGNVKTGINVVDGAFYLTTDTNRLYIGNDDKIVELNKSITVVDSFNDLPKTGVEVGQFYYITGNGGANTNNRSGSASAGNILAVCVSVLNNTPTWVQVNPDTNTDTGYEYFETNGGLSVSDGTVQNDATNGKQIKYTISLHPKKTGVNGNPDVQTLSDITADFYVKASDIGSIAVATDISVSSSAVANNKTTVKVKDNGSNTEGSFVLAGGNNVTLSGGNGSDIVINAKDTTYAMTSGADNSNATLSLTPSVNGTAQAAQNVYFKAGTDLTVDGTTAGEITYAHATYATPSAMTGTAESIASGENSHTFSVVDAIGTSNGHVTSVTKKNITVRDTTYTPESITADANGHLTFSIKDSNNETHTASSRDNSGSPVLFHKITVDGTEVTKYNQENLGSFYSAAEVDNKINGLNAMTYKGKVGTVADGGDVTALPTIANDTIHVGDTYLVVTNGIGSDSNSKVGDLYIASGTETNGKITSGLSWTLVKAGERDTTYNFQTATIDSAPSIQYQAAGTGGWNTIASIVGGTKLTASLSNGTITIDHDSIANLPSTAQGNNSSITSALAFGGTFKVPSVTVDGQGHVTVLSEKEIQLPSSDKVTYEISATTNADTNKANVTLTPSTGDATNAIVTGDSNAINVGLNGQNELAISHKNLLSTGTAGTAYGLATNVAPANDGTGKFKVPSIKVNAQGHVTEVAEHEVTIPANVDTTYQLRDTTAAVANNMGTFTLHLSDTASADGHASTAMLDIATDSLQISTVTGNSDALQIDIVWGSF